MFELYDKKTGKMELIYAVSEDSCGYPKFLIRKNNQWIYRSAKHHMSKNERRITAYSVIEAEEIRTLGAVQLI